MRLTPALCRIAAALALLSATACGADKPVPPGGPPSGSTTLVLGVRDIPGKPGAAKLRPMPGISLYGDGTLIAPSGQTGALERATAYHLTKDQLKRLYADAYAQGLAKTRSPEKSETIDGTTLLITLTTDQGVVTTQAPADGSLQDYRAGLAPASWPSTAFSANPRPYDPPRLAVFAGYATDSTAPAKPWPFTPPDQGTPTREGWCTILTPDQSAQAKPLAHKATPETPWTSSGHTYWLTFRPLLPHERDCADLGP
ncbi:hypothetical protein [Streptomyces sp. 7N604]|uniref:hypothetical protein n=1 Tax=Streptomyces sp. 7N604 TaxID=3457415 RepID=UPI003FD131BB